MISKEQLRKLGRFAFKFFLSIGLLAVVGGIIAGIFWIKSNQIKAAMSAPPPPEMPVSVSLVEARSAEYRNKTVVVGSVLANKTIGLRNELTGVVRKVSMVPGGVVKAGDVLIEFDDRTEQANLKIARATLKLAEAALERSRRLSQANANSQQEYEVAEAEAARAQAECERLEAIVERKKIIAPFDAQVGLFELHPGQYLVEGTQITTLEGIADFMYVDFAMPAHVSDWVRIGDSVAMEADGNSSSIIAEIVALDSRADAASRSLMARAKVTNFPESLRPGDSARVTIQYGPKLPVIEIPATAVRRGPTGTMVYVAEQVQGEDGAPPAMRAKLKPVVVAGGSGEMNYVAGGLSAGEKIVTDGSFKVMDGSLLSSSESTPQ